MSEEIMLSLGNQRWVDDTLETIKRLTKENALLRQWMREATGMSDADLTMAIRKAMPEHQARIAGGAR